MSMKFIDRALENPAAMFGAPADVLAAAELTRNQKIEVLRRWEYDARQLEVAQEENMTARGGTALSDVLKALQSLQAERPASAPTKSG